MTDKASLGEVTKSVNRLVDRVRVELGQTERGNQVLIELDAVNKRLDTIRNLGKAPDEIPPGSDQIICGTADKNGQ